MALPIIFLHGAFHFGGWLTTLLMIVLIVVTISGLFGAYLQHTLPTRMMHEVGYETIYDQIDHIREGWSPKPTAVPKHRRRDRPNRRRGHSGADLH